MSFLNPFSIIQNGSNNKKLNLTTNIKTVNVENIRNYYYFLKGRLFMMHVKIGQMAVIGILSHIIFIYLTWRVIVASINVEPLIKKGRVTEARILILFITIVIGSGVSRFFLEILQWSQDLIYLL